MEPPAAAMPNQLSPVSDHEAAALREVLDLVLDGAPPLGQWAHLVVLGNHENLVAQAVWGRPEVPEDDFFETLPRYRGVPVGAEWWLDGRTDVVELRDPRDDGDSGVVLAHEYWLPGCTDPAVLQLYRELRTAGVCSELATTMAQSLGDHPG